MLKGLINRLPARLRWSLHNLVSHPVSEVVFLVTGDEALAGRIHDATIPEHEQGQGRG